MMQEVNNELVNISSLGTTQNVKLITSDKLVIP